MSKGVDSVYKQSTKYLENTSDFEVNLNSSMSIKVFIFKCRFSKHVSSDYTWVVPPGIHYSTESKVLTIVYADLKVNTLEQHRIELQTHLAKEQRSTSRPI